MPNANDPLAPAPMPFSTVPSKIVLGVFMFLTGAILSLLLRSSGTEQHLTNMDAGIARNDHRLDLIELSLSNGGPAALALRVDALQVDLNDMKMQVRDIWQVTVRGQPIRH